jgi:hypothetical protein
MGATAMSRNEQFLRSWRVEFYVDFVRGKHYSSTFKSSPKNQRTGYASVTHVQKIKRPNVGTAWAWQWHAGGSDTETPITLRLQNPKRTLFTTLKSFLPNHTFYVIIYQVIMWKNCEFKSQKLNKKYSLLRAPCDHARAILGKSHTFLFGWTKWRVAIKSWRHSHVSMFFVELSRRSKERSMLAAKFSGRWNDSLEKDADGNFFID